MNIKMKTKTITLILFLLLAVVGGAKAQDDSWSDEGNRDTDWGSDYEAATIFTISTSKQLAQFAYMVNNGQDFNGKTVTLGDVQHETPVYPANNSFYLSGYSWVPIGTTEHPFNGTFDGNGKSVTYVTIEGSNSYQGFFGYIGASGTVKNLVFDYGSRISGSTQVGTLAGYNAGTVQYCLVLNATVSGDEYVGTIIGQNFGTVTDCYSLDSSSGIGAVGVAGSSAGKDINGAQRLFFIEAGNGLREDDFTASVGDALGIEVGSGDYYDDGIQYNYYHWYKTGSQVTLTSNIDGYDVTFNVSGKGASIDGNVVTVGTENITVSLASKTPAEWSGTGTVGDPYLIYNREQLEMLATRVNDGNSYDGQFFRLEEDISYGDVANSIYTVIGIDADHPFSGTFDGNGNEIKYGDAQSTGSYVGHFGYNKGVIKNLSVSSSNFQGCGYVGIIAGYNEGMIENCRVKTGSAALIGGNDTYHYYGGVVGFNKGTIKTTICAANVRSGYYKDEDDYPVWVSDYNVSYSGGIAGYNEGTIENCLYLGSELMGSSYVGAIVGENYGGTLENNYYHNNQYEDLGWGSNQAANNIGTQIFGVGNSDGITGSDVDGAKLAKVVKLPSGGTPSNPYGVGLSASPIFVTSTNPNELGVSVYSDGILFDDGYLGDRNSMDNAFYTSATTVELICTSTVPSGYSAEFIVDSEYSSIEGSTLTIGNEDDVVTVTANLVRGVDPNCWLAYRSESFSNFDENGKVITITSAEELSLLAYNVNFEEETYEDYTVILGEDIDLDGHTWEPIGYGVGGNSSGIGVVSPGSMGSDMGGFLGTFDGAGHVINNMNTEYPSYVGLFSIVGSGVTVKNVTITNASVKGNSYMGVVAGLCQGIIENCHVTNGSVMSASVGDDGEETGMSPGALYPTMMSMGYGGIAGMCQGGSILGCTVMGTNIDVSSADMGYGVGGITGGLTPGRSGEGVGTIGGPSMLMIPATMKDCLFGGNIFVPAESMGFGAIIGMEQSGGDAINAIANNYYVDGNNANATLNTTLKGVGSQFGEGEDTNGATRGYVYKIIPEGIGELVTEYEYDLEKAYENGILYDGLYYMATPPSEIILDDKGDNADVILANTDVTADVTINGRTLYKDGSWNTICLPFNLTAAQIESSCLAGAEIRTLTDASVTGYHVSLSFGVEEEIIAGAPYLIKWESGDDIVDPTFEDVTLVPELKEFEFGDGYVNFSGYYDTFVASPDDEPLVYYLATNNTLKYPSKNRTMYPFRAFFTFTANNGDDDDASGANAFDFSIDFGDGVIDGVTFAKNGTIMQSGKWFTIDGRQLAGKPTAKGVYLHNGKTIVVK